MRRWLKSCAMQELALQMKEWLERRPFDQAVEDKDRDVDGRSVSREDMMNPRGDLVPERPGKQYVEAHFKRFEEQKALGFLGREKGESCTMKRSTYNPDPK